MKLDVDEIIELALDDNSCPCGCQEDMKLTEDQYELSKIMITQTFHSVSSYHLGRQFKALEWISEKYGQEAKSELYNIFTEKPL